MAKITNHDNSYSARSSTEPLARTAERVAGRGPLSFDTKGNPIWYNDDTSLLSKTVNVAGTSDKRRTGR